MEKKDDNVVGKKYPKETGGDIQPDSLKNGCENRPYHRMFSDLQPNDDKMNEGKSIDICQQRQDEEDNISQKRPLLSLEDTDEKERQKRQKGVKKIIDLTDVPAQLPIMSVNQDGSSKYQGVSFLKVNKKWTAQIKIDGKRRHIGCYDDEEEAAVDYARAVFKYGRKKVGRPQKQKFIALSDFPAQLPIMSNRSDGISKYQGVYFQKARNNWVASISIDGKRHLIGTYDDEEEAAVDYARAVFKYRPRNAFIDLTDVLRQSPIINNRQNATSKYQGVHFNKEKNKWVAKISIDGKRHLIGTYDDEEEAAIDYARAVFKYTSKC